MSTDRFADEQSRIDDRNDGIQARASKWLDNMDFDEIAEDVMTSDSIQDILMDLFLGGNDSEKLRLSNLLIDEMNSIADEAKKTNIANGRFDE
jgi:hypothetical protein